MTTGHRSDSLQMGLWCKENNILDSQSDDEGAMPSNPTIMSEHFVDKCSCGKVIGQCRCMSANKTVRIVQDGCPECKAKAQTGAAAWKKMTALQVEVKP